MQLPLQADGRMWENVVAGTVLAAVVCFQLISEYAWTPLKDVDTKRLHSLVANSEGTCPFALDVETRWDDGPRDDILVESWASGDFLLLPSLRRALRRYLTRKRPEDVLQWFTSQVSMRHLIPDVMSQDNVWIVLFAMTMIILLAHVAVFDPFVSKAEKEKKLPENFRKMEIASTERSMRKYFAEKLIILAFVVVRPADKFGDVEVMSAGVLQGSWNVSDATLFAMWYLLVWSLQTITSTTNSRFEIMVASASSRVTVPLRLLSLLLSVFCVSAAMTSLALTSFQIIHPLYAGILLSEAVCVLVRVTYVAFRALQYCAGKDDELSHAKVVLLKRSTDVIIDMCYFTQYFVLLWVGVVLHRRIIPSVFVPRATTHLRRAVETLYAWNEQGETTRLIE